MRSHEPIIAKQFGLLLNPSILDYKSADGHGHGEMFLITCLQIALLLTVLGDPRSNQNPALLAFGLLFFRWHNVIANRIQLEYPHWSDEDIFQRARRLVIASLQVRSY